MSWFDIVKQAVDSVENQLDTILDQSKEAEGNSTSLSSTTAPTSTATAGAADDHRSAATIFSRLKNITPISISEPSPLIAVATQQHATQRKEDDEKAHPQDDNTPISTEIIPGKGIDTPAPANPEVSQIKPRVATTEKTSQNGWGADDDDLDLEIQSPTSVPVALETETITAVNNDLPASLPTTIDSQKAAPSHHDSTEKLQSTPDTHSQAPDTQTKLSPLPSDAPATTIKNSSNPSIEKNDNDLSSMEKSLLQREQQLMKSKQENADLFNQIDALNAQLAAERALKERLAESNTKLSTELNNARKSSAGGPDLAKVIAEKEASIAGLLQEGENLSKEVLKANMSVKKYRKDMEDIKKELAEKQKQIEEKQSKIDSLALKLSEVTESEKRVEDSLRDTTESMMRLSKKSTEMEKDYIRNQQEKTDLEAKLASCTEKLDKLEKADAGSAAQLEAFKKQIEANNELKENYDQLDIKYRDLQNKHQDSMVQSQLTLATLQHDIASKEEDFQNRIKALEMRLASSEANFLETNMANQDATAPLLAQIASLESALMLAKTDWSSLEISLIQRCQAAEKDRNDVWAQCEELTAKVKLLQEDLAKEQKLRAEENQVKLQEKQKEMIVSLEKDITEWKSRSSLLETQLTEAQESLKSTTAEMTRSHEESIQTLKQQLKERYEKNEQKSPLKVDLDSPVSPDTTPETARKNYAAGNAIGALTAQLKHTKAQIQSLELQLTLLTTSRDEITSHMVELEHENDDLKEKLASLALLQTELESLDEKYNTVLELLGEKEERILELEHDIVDMKQAFRSQLLNIK